MTFVWCNMTISMVPEFLSLTLTLPTNIYRTHSHLTAWVLWPQCLDCLVQPYVRVPGATASEQFYGETLLHIAIVNRCSGDFMQWLLRPGCPLRAAGGGPGAGRRRS